MRSEQSYLIVMLIILATIFLIALNHNLSYPLQAHAQLNNADNAISSKITSDVTNKVFYQNSQLYFAGLSRMKILIM